MFLKIVLLFIIAFMSYEISIKIYNEKILQKINHYINDKNEKYYNEFIKKYEKNKKIKIIDRLNILYKINLIIEKANIKRNIIVNPISIILLSVLCVILAYKFTFEFLKVVALSIIVAIPCGIVPILIINYIGTIKEEKLEKVFLNFLLQLKNYSKVSNDIAGAFRNVETVEPLQTFINKFNIEIASGVKFETAIEHLRDKISIEKFKEFFFNIQYCYLYGGNFCVLIDKNYNMILEIQKEKNKRLQETKSARLVLFILMFLNIFVYINYIKNNYDNYIIMQRTLTGTIILYWNFISMWLLAILSYNVKKLDY